MASTASSAVLVEWCEACSLACTRHAECEDNLIIDSEERQGQTGLSNAKKDVIDEAFRLENERMRHLVSHERTKDCSVKGSLAPPDFSRIVILHLESVLPARLLMGGDRTRCETQPHYQVEGTND